MQMSRTGMPIAEKLIAPLRRRPAAGSTPLPPDERRDDEPAARRPPAAAGAIPGAPAPPEIADKTAEIADKAAGAVVSCETGLSCLFQLGIQNGNYVDAGAVRRRNLVDGATLPIAQLAALAGEFGLSAERARLDWRALQTRPFAHPLVLILANANAVILMGVRRGGEEVAICRPAVPRRRGVFSGARRARTVVARRGADRRTAAAKPRGREIRLFLVHPKAVRRTPADARRRRGRVGDASDRIVGADLFSDPGRQGGAEPGLLHPLYDHGRHLCADPVRLRL